MTKIENDSWISGIKESKKYEGINTVNAEKLLNLPYKKTEYILEGLIPYGLTLLCGASKIGKSWLVLDFALHLAQGIRFWDTELKKTSVLYISLEDTYARIQHRLHMLTDEAPDNLFFATSCSSIGEGLSSEIDAFLNAHNDVKLIIIDTFQKIRCGRDAKSYGGMYAMDYQDISEVKKIADSHNISILMIHHQRKMQDLSDPFNDVSGTTGIMGAADTTLMIKLDTRESNTALLTATGRDIEYQQLLLRRDGVKWQLVERKNRETIVRESIPDYLYKIADLMKNRINWEGTATDLLKEINDSKTSPNVVSKNIAYFYSDVFQPVGIAYSTSRTGKARIITLHNIGNIFK